MPGSQNLRRAAYLAVGLALTLATVYLFGGQAKPSNEQATRAEAPASRRVPLPVGALGLMGRVLDAGRPVPGARLQVFLDVDGEEPASRACACEPGCTHRLGDCGCSEAAAELAEALDASGAPPGLSPVRSDKDGAFRIEGLASGRYRLLVSAGERAAWARADLPSPEPLSVQLGPALRLAGSAKDRFGNRLDGVLFTTWQEGGPRMEATAAKSDFDLGALPAGAWHVLGRKAGFVPAHASTRGEWVDLFLSEERSVSGTVRAEGRPVGEVEVRLRAKHHDLRLTTDAQGQFRFVGLSEGRYQLEATQGRLFASREIDLWGADATGADLDLLEGGFLEGQVRDEQGRPVAGASVEARRERWDHRPGPGVQADAEGRYRLGPTPPGRWEVQAQAPGYQESRTRGINMEPGLTKHLDLELQAGAAMEGVVQDHEGRPIQGAEVSTDPFPGATSQLDMMSRHEPRQATTDAQGRFWLEGARAGARRVRVSHPDYADLEQQATAPDRALRLTLEPGLQVEGVVLEPDGTPARQAEVRAAQKEGNRECQVDALGHFRLQGLARGTVSLSAYRTDGEGSEYASPPSVTVDLSGPGAAPVTLRLEPLRAISGRVIDGQGKPVGGVVVVAQPEIGDEAYSRTFGGSERLTQADGAFAFERLGGSKYRLEVASSAYETAPKTVPAGTQGVELVATYWGRLFGRVLLPDDSPCPSFEVNGTPFFSADGGSWELPAQTEGPVRLVARAQGYAPAALEFSVRAGAENAVPDLRLGKGRTLSGVVVDAVSGAPVAEAEVQPEGERGADLDKVRHWGGMEPKGTTTGPDGTFWLDDAGGVVRLRVKHPGYQLKAVEVGESEARLHIALESGPAIAGRITDADGRPLRRLVFLTGDSDHEIYSGEDGTYLVGGLTPGPHRVQVGFRMDEVIPERLGNFGLRARTVIVPEQGRARADFQESQGQELTVHLAGAERGSLGDWAAILVEGSPPIPRTAEELQAFRASGLDSFFMGGLKVFRGLGTGAYTVVAAREERGKLQITGAACLVTEAPNQTLELAVPPAP